MKASETLHRAKACEHQGEIEAARRLYQTVLAAYPGNQAARRALARLLHGPAGPAAGARAGEPPPEALRELLTLANAGQRRAALHRAERLAQGFPTSAALWNLLGIMRVEAGQLTRAEAAFRRALAVDASFPDAWNNLGNVQRQRGQRAAAVESFRRAIALRPDYAEAHGNLGTALRGEDDAAAEACYRRAIALKPGYAAAHGNLGAVLIDRGDLDEAIVCFRRALELTPNDPVALNNLGNALQDWGDLAGAEALYQRALQVRPEDIDALKGLGRVRDTRGDFDGAAACYRAVLRLNPDDAECFRTLSADVEFHSGDRMFEAMRLIYTRAEQQSKDRCQICFALAKACEDVGDLAAAFSYLREGNALRKAQLGYDIATDRRRIAAIRDHAPALRAVALPAEPPAAVVPIFILGLPRSGTTLVEQIVSSHPLVSGAGELPYVPRLGAELATGWQEPSPERLRAFRRGYLDRLAAHAAGRPYVIDKMLDNALYIGLIAQALPEARIVHVRRDPRAVCWSLYKHYFHGAGLGYSYDLADAVAYSRLHEALMADWARLYPDRVHALSYEALTEDPAAETRRLIAHLGLDWDAACLHPERNLRAVRTASQHQVRQAVYRGSSAAWRRFAPFLGDAFDGLEA